MNITIDQVNSNYDFTGENEIENGMRNQVGLNTALIDTKKNLNDDLDLHNSSSIRLIE